MKKTAHGTPILIKDGVETLLERTQATDESSIQHLIYKHPGCLPISDLDESYNPLLPVCMELNTPAGLIDILFISPSGEITIVETKLWRNHEARRTVVAQILDYAKELSKWNYADLQREVNRRLKKSGNFLYEIAKNCDENLLLPESDFVDAVSRNLRRGKFLLLIVGDGIREGAEEIAEFLISTGHLNFTFSMIELAIYRNETAGTILFPRVVAKTIELHKITVEIPPGMTLSSTLNNSIDSMSPSDISPERDQERSFYSNFWMELINEIEFDDPSQPLPKPTIGQNLYVYPGKTRRAWISAYFMKSKKRVGVFFRCQQDQEGRDIYEHLSTYKDDIQKELGDKVVWSWEEGQGAGIRLLCDDVFNENNRLLIKDFFKEWLNTFVNVIRPRMKGF
ncbi:DUF4268 domain-containing protein [Spirochaeta dissipatitropha]